MFSGLLSLLVCILCTVAVLLHQLVTIKLLVNTNMYCTELEIKNSKMIGGRGKFFLDSK